MCSNIGLLLFYGLAGAHIEAAVVDRPPSRRGPLILHEKHFSTRFGDEVLLEVRIRVVHHCARTVDAAANPELSLEDVPDLRKVVLMLRMIAARFVTHDAGIRLGRSIGARMKQHLARLLAIGPSPRSE